MPSASPLPPFSLPSPSLSLTIQISSGPRVSSQYKQTHRLPGPADKSLEFHYTSPLHPIVPPGESHTSPQSTVRYARWISPFHLVPFSPRITQTRTHTHNPPQCNCAPLIFPFTSQSKFIIGDKGLPLPFPLKKKNLYRSKIRQSPRCNESDPRGIWAPRWEGRRKYDPELMWKTGPPEKSLEGSDNDQWIKQEPNRGRHGGWWESKSSKIQRLGSRGTSFSKDLFHASLLTLKYLHFQKSPNV